MIPRLPIEDGVNREYLAYVDALRDGGFTGEIHIDYATRLVAATDNSVYQIIPQAVVYPRSQHDISLAMQLLEEPRFHGVTLSPRGGGTGTDGQALNDGIVLDVTRHMNRILEIDVVERWARVEPGVVLDQLNAAMRPHGLFFAPTVAPGDRATLGGMIGTDAAGEGSRIYGKTSNHIIELTTILRGGITWRSHELNADALNAIKQRDDAVGEVHRIVDEVAASNRELIDRVVPQLTRFASGYNLGMVRQDGSFNLNWLLAGSEGTLGIVAEAILRLTPLPKHHVLVALKYASFDEALAHAETIFAFGARGIETMDEKVVDLARTDEAWLLVREFMDDHTALMRTINLVEFAGDSLEEIAVKAQALRAWVDQHRGEQDYPAGCCIITERGPRDAMWALRKRAVGLLGNLPGNRKPVPFIEDAAVPPENLRNFVREFRAILDKRGLDYGMFGHVDVGCLHVRPALDMTDPADEALLRPISDEVAAITKKYGGILWGEHGKGMRSEYNPSFYGRELYAAMQRIKGAFDPHNQLNPGKIASPVLNHGDTETRKEGENALSIPLSESQCLRGSITDPVLLTVEATTRGSYDRQISVEIRSMYDDAIRCNGNGQCYSDDQNYIMCPSWKGMRDRIHSPKGRAALMREWLRRLSISGFDLSNGRAQSAGGATTRLRTSAPRDFSHEVYDAMQGCLACKACAGQCPVKVDVPDFRAEFLELYHARYRRPLRDHLIAGIERTLPLLARMPRFVNAVQRTGMFQRAMQRAGMVDVPSLATPTLKQLLRARRIPPFDMAEWRSLTAQQQSRCVLIVQDAFTSFYQPRIVARLCDLLIALGFTPRIVPYFPSGKSLHVRGFVRRFRRLAHDNGSRLREVAELGIDMISIDPAITLVYRDEYRKALGSREPGFHIELVQEWLVRRLPDLRLPSPSQSNTYRLFNHCTERSLVPQSPQQWRTIFTAFGHDLEPIRAGCCGMGGAWGHEAVHLEHSRGIFNMSWGAHLRSNDGIPLATGYSCREQVARFTGRELLHPIEALATTMEQGI